MSLPARPPDFTDREFLVWELLLKGRPPEPFTQADLDALPESSGYRFELLDGILIVSPGPNLAHQRLVASLHLLLARQCPAHYEVLFAPFNLKPSEARTPAGPVRGAQRGFRRDDADPGGAAACGRGALAKHGVL